MKVECASCGNKFVYEQNPNRSSLLTKEGSYSFCSKACFDKFMRERNNGI